MRIGQGSQSLILGLSLLLLAGCGAGDGTPTDRFPDSPQTPEDVEFHPQLGVDLATAVRTESGVYYQVVAEGQEGGPVVEAGDRVTFHYTGWLWDGRKFDSSRDAGEAITFQIGVGGLIQGWDLTIPGMRVGERRLLIIPSDLGYGAGGGGGGTIPPHSVLVFDVEVLALPDRESD